MTITSITEDWRGNTSTQEIGAVRSSTRHMVVYTDVYTDPDEIRKDARLPIDGNNHPLDSSQYCTQVKIEPRDNTRTVFDVTAEYSNDVDDQELEISKKGGTGVPPNPFDDPPEIEIYNQQRPVALWACAKTGAVAFVATNDVIDPPPMGVAVDSILRITRNEADYSYETHAKPYLWKVNSQDFSGAYAGDVLCVAVNARRMFERGVRYWSITREFAVRNWKQNLIPNADYIDATFSSRIAEYVTGWSLVIPHVSYYEIIDNPAGTGKTKARIFDDNGNPIEKPQFVNADGSQREPDNAGKVKPIMLVIHPYDSADFNALNLGV